MRRSISHGLKISRRLIFGSSGSARHTSRSVHIWERRTSLLYRGAHGNRYQATGTNASGHRTSTSWLRDQGASPLDEGRTPRLDTAGECQRISLFDRSIGGQVESTVGLGGTGTCHDVDMGLHVVRTGGGVSSPYERRIGCGCHICFCRANANCIARCHKSLDRDCF
jgi:hypothetical protein